MSKHMLKLKRRQHMNDLLYHRLMQYCRKYAIDPAEIDSGISYDENMEHLEAIVKMIECTGDMFEISRHSDLAIEYFRSHTLQIYVEHEKVGKTTSRETGTIEPTQKGFSLIQAIKAGYL